MNQKVTAIMTCFNRKEKTITCLKTLTERNRGIDFSFIVVDDGCTDGTAEEVISLGLNVTLLTGTGNLFWCGGMRYGIEHIFDSNPPDGELCLLVNDDVMFNAHSIEKMFERLANRKDTVIVGATCDDNGNFTYGLKKKEKWYKKNITKRIEPSEEIVVGETCNANCVLIPNYILKTVGNMDSVYTHSLGDYDLGFRMTRAGFKLISSAEYVGVCNGNSVKGTWGDTSLSRKERLKKKESPKGSPFREWWHFLYQNYGIATAIKGSVNPYIKILLKK